MTTQFIEEDFSQGMVASKDPSDLAPGELQKAENCLYKPGDPKRLHKQKGRTEFGDTGEASKVKGVSLLRFDDGSDVVIALAGTDLYSATASRSSGASFSSIKSSLSSSATKLHATHYNDKYYVCNDGGVDRLQVIESDGTIYDAGLRSPIVAPTAVAGGSGTANQTNAASGSDIQDFSLVSDADKTTFGYMSLSAPGSVTTTFSFAANTPGVARTGILEMALHGTNYPGPDFENFDVGAISGTAFAVNVKVEVSQDAGVTWNERRDSVYYGAVSNINNQFNVISSRDEADIKVRVTMTMTTTGIRATLAIFSCRVQTGSTVATFAMTTGVYYAYTEYDEDRGEESAASPAVLVDDASLSQVTLTLPAAAQNSRTTHYRVYRTHDGGTAPVDLGRIAETTVGDTTFVDDYEKYDKDTVAQPLLRQLIVQTTDASTYYEMDTPPPTLDNIRSYQGSLIGISATNNRALHYSIPGYPGSWPEIYVITAFPWEEHDTLVDLMDMGDLLIIGARNAIGRLNILPRVVHSTFDQSRVEKIQGAPGVVGGYAMTRYTSDGQPFCAWISDYGIYVTNGVQYFNISRNMDWESFESYDKSNWALSYDPLYQVLIMDYSSTGATVNNRYAFLHIAPEHQRQDRQPKITMGHYGEASNRAIGQVSNTRTIYTAHADDGKVYVEDNGLTDAANSYNASGDWPMIVKSRRMHGEDAKFSIVSSRLRHSDFGSGETMSIAWTAGGEDAVRTQSRTISVPLNSTKGDQFGVLLGGLWHEYELTHTGSGRGALLETRHRARRAGPQGKVAVA